MILKLIEKWILIIWGTPIALLLGAWLWENGLPYTLHRAGNFALALVVALGFLVSYFWPVAVALILLRAGKPKPCTRMQAHAHTKAAPPA